MNRVRGRLGSRRSEGEPASSSAAEAPAADRPRSLVSLSYRPRAKKKKKKKKKTLSCRLLVAKEQSYKERALLGGVFVLLV